MKKIALILITVSLVLVGANQAWAPSAQANASLSATVTQRVTLALARDTNSVTRGSATQIVFDKYDDEKPPAGQTGSTGYMYAPYRSETNKNWHLASILANGTGTLTFAVAVSGLSPTSIVGIWNGGFYTPGATTPIGTRNIDDGNPATDDWSHPTASYTCPGPFSGTVPISYQLNVSNVAGSVTPYTGTVTYTVTQSS